MALRTESCIDLGPSGNWQRSTKYFNLNTGKAVTRRTVTVVPMPDRIVKKVNAWGDNPRGKKYADDLKFLDRSTYEFSWESEELYETLEHAEDPIYQTLTVKIPGVVLDTDTEDEGRDLEETPPPSHDD